MARCQLSSIAGARTQQLPDACGIGEAMNVKSGKTTAPEEALQGLAVLQRCFGNSLLAVYLHGSAVSGGLHPNSDVDLLAVIDRPATHAVRERLIAGLLSVSGRYPVAPAGRHPLELTVLHRADLTSLAYPAKTEFVYGEWLRDAFEAGEVPKPGADPEFTLLLAQARNQAISLIGPPPTDVLPIIPRSDICRAIGDAFPELLDRLKGDERNVLLTLARMWRTLIEGDFVPKDVAAEWAIPRLPAEAAAPLARARNAYLTPKSNDCWAQQEVRQVADRLSECVAAALRAQRS